MEMQETTWTFLKNSGIILTTGLKIATSPKFHKKTTIRKYIKQLPTKTKQPPSKFFNQQKSNNNQINFKQATKNKS